VDAGADCIGHLGFSDSPRSVSISAQVVDFESAFRDLSLVTTAEALVQIWTSKARGPRAIQLYSKSLSPKREASFMRTS